MMVLKAILAAGMMALLAACATAPGGAPSQRQTIALLQAGGNLIVMRHSLAPSRQKTFVGMTAGCVPEGPRGLDAAGLGLARFIGEWLAEEEVPIAKVYTSDICRAYDTAALVAAGRAGVIPRPEMKSDDPEIAKAFQETLAAELAANPDANIVLVTHSNVTPLYWAEPLGGETETPSGRLHVIRKVEAPVSGSPGFLVARIDFKSTVTVRALP